MDNVKIEISQEDYQSLRSNPNVQIDMEARYFIVGFKTPAEAPQETHRRSFYPVGYVRTPSDRLGLRREPRTGELTGKQAEALRCILPSVKRHEGERSDRLAEIVSAGMSTTKGNGSYYVKCLMKAGVLGGLRD